jgi:hypothetical protein
MGVIQSPAFTMDMKSAPASLSAANSIKGE